MSISFRQKRNPLTLTADVDTHLLIEGNEGTFTNGCDLISLQFWNLSANAVESIKVFVDSGGYGAPEDYVEDAAATTLIGALGANASMYKQINPNGWKRFKLVANSADGTSIRFEIAGINSQG